jgi:hypothetical protein
MIFVSEMILAITFASQCSWEITKDKQAVVGEHA